MLITRMLSIRLAVVGIALLATQTRGGVVTGSELGGIQRLENLTLDQALELADQRQPEIAEAIARIEAAEGRARQAGAFPNPEAILGAQQLPLSSRPTGEQEYVAGVGQTIPLSRRLSKAREAELLDREVRVRGLEVKRREIHRRVHGAFAAALYQESAHQAQTQILENTRKAVATTRARVEAGDALREDLARVEMEVARTQVEYERADSLRRHALLALASAIGDATLPVGSVAGTLETTFEVPTIEALMATLTAQPESAQAEADIRARMARVDLAEAERIPDVKVELLYHRLEASQADTLDVGLSIPLPLFNRNQGRLREARAEVAAAEARSRLTQNELVTRLQGSYLRLTAALANRRTFKTELLAGAETVLKGAEARYAAGDISLADLLPVRRDWAEIQFRYLESLREVMQAWGDVRSWAMAR